MQSVAAVARKTLPAKHLETIFYCSRRDDDGQPVPKCTIPIVNFLLKFRAVVANGFRDRVKTRPTRPSRYPLLPAEQSVQAPVKLVFKQFFGGAADHLLGQLF
jgi:hypothetical protein